MISLICLSMTAGVRTPLEPHTGIATWFLFKAMLARQGSPGSSFIQIFGVAFYEKISNFYSNRQWGI